MVNRIPVITLFLLSTSFSAFSSNLAEWSYPTLSTPVLRPAGENPLPIELAVVNTDTWLVSLIDLRKPGVSGSSCYDGELSDKPEQGPALRINGKLVNFTYGCINKDGVGIMQPASEQGRSYLNSLALSGKEIEINLDEDQSLHYPASNVEDMKKRVAEMKSAM